MKKQQQQQKREERKSSFLICRVRALIIIAQAAASHSISVCCVSFLVSLAGEVYLGLAGGLPWAAPGI